MNKPAPSNLPPPTIAGLLGLNLRRIAIALVVFVALGVAGHYGWKYYQQQREIHLARQAREYLDKSDLRSALLSARETLKLNYNNLQATTVMAEIADRYSSPESVMWRGRAAELAGYPADGVLHWSATALRFNQLIVADDALTHLKKADRRGAQYHQIAGGLAIAVNQLQMAEVHFQLALRDDPKDPVNQLNLAMVRLNSTNDTMVAESRRTLERLASENPTNRLAALRALSADAGRRQDRKNQLLWATKLASDPKADTSDKLEYLNVLRLAEPERFKKELTGLQAILTNQPQAVYLLIRWMNTHDLAAEAVSWHRTLPDNVRRDNSVQMAGAESLMVEKNWPALRERTGKGDWNQLEFMRKAMLSRALRELGLDVESRIYWQQSLGEARRQTQAFVMLSDLAEHWQWNDEAEELWWLIARGQIDQQRALRSLYRLYTKRGDTSRLLLVVSRSYQLDPRDDTAKNNVAMYSLLLGKDLENAHRLAKELYQAHPQDPGFLSTYAFSLHVQGRSEEAAKLMQAIPAKLLESTALAVYEGIFLAASGQTAAAKKYLALGQKAEPSLLPEERQLLNDAWQRVRKP